MRCSEKTPGATHEKSLLDAWKLVAMCALTIHTWPCKRIISYYKRPALARVRFFLLSPPSHVIIMRTEYPGAVQEIILLTSWTWAPAASPWDGVLRSGPICSKVFTFSFRYLATDAWESVNFLQGSWKDIAWSSTHTSDRWLKWTGSARSELKEVLSNWVAQWLLCLCRRNLELVDTFRKGEVFT